MSGRMNVVFSWLKRGRWYIQWNIYSAIKRKESSPFITIWMDCEGIMFSNVKSEKDRYIYPHSCVESKQTRKLVDTEDRLEVARGKDGGESG